MDCIFCGNLLKKRTGNQRSVVCLSCKAIDGLPAFIVDDDGGWWASVEDFTVRYSMHNKLSLLKFNSSFGMDIVCRMQEDVNAETLTSEKVNKLIRLMLTWV